jgi:superfamily II DNA/RNA helicase
MVALGLYNSLKKTKKLEVREDFRSGKLEILIATETMIDKFDLSKIGTIINFDLPDYTESYVCRLSNLGMMGH